MEMMKPLCCAVLFAFVLPAQQIPDGPGRAEMEKMCKGCHEVARSVSKRQDRNGWAETLNKMVAYGMKASDQDMAVVLDYMSRSFPADDVPRVNINKASAIELESGLNLRRSQAAAIIAYRTKNGDFKSLDDLKNVPQIDVEKLAAKKDRIVF